MILRNITRVKTNVFNQTLEVPVVENHQARIKVERNVVIVVISTLQSNALPMARNVSNARRIISQNLVGSSDSKPGGWGGNPKHFSRKDVNEVENTKFKYDTDIVEFKWIQFSTPMFDSSQDSQNSQNIMFNEMSEFGN